jgi:peptidoglycan/LPS O-acetylase OafA/YrhL
MSTSIDQSASRNPLRATDSRLDYLDATRAFALVLGIVFHASVSFMPIFIGWAVQDVSTSPAVGIFVLVSHSFRMETFFLLAGFFAHVTLHRKGAGEFIRSRGLRIVVPFLAGWFILRPLIVSGWIMGSASLRGDFEFWPGIRAGFQSLTNLPAGIFSGTHLWFLYYLAMITVLTLVARSLIMTFSWHPALAQRSDAVVSWLARPARSGLGLLALVIPTAVTLWFMRYWSVDTPDQELQPHFPVLLLYGGCFILGWMLSRQRNLIPQFARLTPLRWLLAGGGMLGVIFLSEIQTDPAHPHYLAAHVGFVVSYAIMMWSFVFLTVGVFKKICQQPRAWIRYVADSSYWMYLIHLPIVVWLQVAVAEVQLHWSLKLTFISLLTIAVSLVTYDLWVRSTWLGALLNGRRRARVIPEAIRKISGRSPDEIHR